MIRYELFPRYAGGSVWNSPFLKAVPAPGSVSFEPFKVTQLNQFIAYRLQNAPLKDGNVIIAELDTDFPREFASRSIDAFLELSGVGFGQWHLVQGLFIPDLSRTKRLPFYLGTLDPVQSEIEVSTAEQVVYARTPFDEAVPYGALLTLKAKHDTELFSKLTEQLSLLESQERRARARHDEVPTPNAYIQLSEHIQSINGNSEKVPVLIGHLKR